MHIDAAGVWFDLSVVGIGKGNLATVMDYLETWPFTGMYVSGGVSGTAVDFMPGGLVCGGYYMRLDTQNPELVVRDDWSSEAPRSYAY